MKLIIVESPTKAKTLSRFLGSDYRIIASMGHVRDLPKTSLGIDINHDFEPDYEIPADKKKAVADIRKEVKNADEVILATDLDREGEAIAYHLMMISGKIQNSQPKAGPPRADKFERIIFHEITKSAILDALAHPRSINMDLVDAQQARRVLDRLVGYKLSPLLWRKVRRGLSAGRVQSPAVRLIVEREREIKAFKTEEYWKIEVELKKKGAGSLATNLNRFANRARDSSNTQLSNSRDAVNTQTLSNLSPVLPPRESFVALLTKINDKKAEVKNKEQADGVEKNLQAAKYKVADVTVAEVKTSPPPPFITSTLQRSGSSVFHWSTKKTMRTAQELYEKGVITYHRTDSVNLSQLALAMAKDYISKQFGANYYSGGRVYKTKSRLAQEAHEAIRPTSLTSNSQLIGDEEKLFRLISNRFVASQMAEQRVEKVTVTIVTDNKIELKAIGQKEIFPGYKKIYGQNASVVEQQLPTLAKDEDLDFVKVNKTQQFTQPPLRYSEGLLVKALEERGIGRPSTYAPIISTIQARQYVEKVEGRFKPTAIGEAVVDFLVGNFADVVDYDFTARIEDDLDAIANAKKQWRPVIADFYQPFAHKLLDVEKNSARVSIKAEPTGEKCPKCKIGDQVIRTGRFGKFLSCSRFPECNWRAVYVEKVQGMKCPLCGGEMVIRKTKKGKTFYGCSNWPKCNWASWRKPKNLTDKSTTITT
jgi:DNA topoisomerase-1